MQPIAAANVSAALADYVVGLRVSGIAELAFGIDEAARRWLAANQDTRQVITDHKGSYSSVSVADPWLGRRGDTLDAIEFEFCDVSPAAIGREISHVAISGKGINRHDLLTSAGGAGHGMEHDDA